MDHAGAPPGAQGRVPGAALRPRRQGAHRAHAGRPARLLCAAGAGARPEFRDALRPRAVAEDLVRRRALGHRRRTAPPAARRADGRPADAPVPGHRAAPGGGRRRVHARPLAQGAARRAGRHAAAVHGGRGRPGAAAQRRGPPALARAPRQPVPGRLAGRHGGHRRQLRLQPGRAEVRVPARDHARRPHPRELAAPPDGSGPARALPARRDAGRAGDGRARARAHRAAAVRALLPDRDRHRALGARPGHPVPGARQRGQFGGLLLPGRDGGGPGAHHAAVRALHQRRAQRAARHRHRLRAPAARGSHPVHLPQVRPPPRRADGRGHQLPPAQRAARRGPRAGPRPRPHRGRGQEPALVRRPQHRPRAPARERLRPRLAGRPAVGRAHRGAHRLSAPPVAAPGRLRHRARRPGAPGAGGKRRHGRAQRHPVGQGRPGHAGSAEGRHPGPGHAQRHPPRAARRGRQAGPPAGAARGAGRRRAQLRDALPRRQRGHLPGREPGPDEHAAAPAAALLLRPGDRGRHRAPRPHPGRHGAPLPAPPQRRRAGRLPQRRGAPGAAAHAGRAHLPGAGDAAGHAGRRLQRRRGRPAAPRHGRLEAQGRPRPLPRAPGGPHGREGL